MNGVAHAPVIAIAERMLVWISDNREVWGSEFEVKREELEID